MEEDHTVREQLPGGMAFSCPRFPWAYPACPLMARFSRAAAVIIRTVSLRRNFSRALSKPRDIIFAGSPQEFLIGRTHHSHVSLYKEIAVFS